MVHLLLLHLLLIAIAAPVAFGRSIDGDASLSADNRGIIAEPGQFPFIALMRIAIPNNNVVGLSACSGAIVGARWVLSTESCVKRMPSVNRTLIVVGAHHYTNDNDNGVVHRANRFVLHHAAAEPNHDTAALIEVTEPIVFGERVQPIALNGDFVEGGLATTVAGWGSYRLGSGGSRISDYLLHWRAETLNSTDCSVALEREMCLYIFRNNGWAADGIGAPAVINGTLVGLNAFRTRRTNIFNERKLFLRVSSYYFWVNIQIIEL